VAIEITPEICNADDVDELDETNNYLNKQTCTRQPRHDGGECEHDCGYTCQDAASQIALI